MRHSSRRHSRRTSLLALATTTLALSLPPDWAIAAETPSPVRLVAPQEFSAHINERIVRAAYDHAGHELEVTNVPPRRALSLSNSGAYDGELFRVAKITEIAENLVRVPAQVNTLSVRGFYIDESIVIDSWDSLDAYKIGIVRGHRYAEKNTEGKRRVVAKSVDLLFEMLGAGRLDVVIVTNYSGAAANRRAGLQNVRMSDRAIAEIPIYHFLHKKNRHLVDEISAAIEATRDETLESLDLDAEFERFRLNQLAD